MPIQVTCHCGQTFMAKDELKGQTLLCPKCHDPITIGEGTQQGQRQSGGGMTDLFDEAGIEEIKGNRCPKCLAVLKPGAVLCVQCGYHLQSGEKVEGATVRVAGERGHGEAAEILLDRASRTIDEDLAEEKKKRKQGLPAWVYLIALLGLVAFAIAMYMMPKDRSFIVSGFILVGLSMLASLYYTIRILIVAFSESTTCGLLYIFLPFYSLYYIFTRWDEVGGYFLLIIVCNVINSIGWVMVHMGPMLAEEKKEGAFHPSLHRPPTSAVVVFAGESETAWTCANGLGS